MTQSTEKIEKWEDLTLANNFIFYKVMRHHPDACQHLIELLLGIKIEKMEFASEEELVSTVLDNIDWVRNHLPMP